MMQIDYIDVWLYTLFGSLEGQAQNTPLVTSMLSHLAQQLSSPERMNYTVAGIIASVLADTLTIGGGRILSQHPSKFPPIFDSVLSIFAPIYVQVWKTVMHIMSVGFLMLDGQTVQQKLHEPAHAITQLVVRAGEFHTKLIFAQGKQMTEKYFIKYLYNNTKLTIISRLVEFVAVCTGHPEQDISSLTFSFWCEINALHDDGSKNKHVALVVLLIFRLFSGEEMPAQLSSQLLSVISILCKQCIHILIDSACCYCTLTRPGMYPEEMTEEDLSEATEEDEEFATFRREACDCIEYIYGVVGVRVLDVVAVGLSGMFGSNTSPRKKKR